MCGLEIFPMVKAIEDEDLPMLGISIEKFLNTKLVKHNAWSHALYLGTGMKNIQTFFTALHDKLVIIDGVFDDIPNNAKDPDSTKLVIERFTKHAVERFFKHFEDESLSRDLMNNVMSFQDSKFKNVEMRGSSYWSSVKVESTKLYTDIIKKVFEGGKIAYKVLATYDNSYKDRGELFENNLTNTLNGIDLLCAFNEY